MAFKVVDATELVSKKFEGEPDMIVQGLISEGFVVLAAKQKMGKSFLALNLAVAVASGENALGDNNIGVTQGDVLYLALEDNERRINNRLKVMLGDKPIPANLYFSFSKPDHAMQSLEEWLNEHPDTKLIVIDVLAKLLPTSRPNSDSYQETYKVLGPVQSLALEKHTAILAIAHMRKNSSDDIQDEIMGSAGLPSVADTIITLVRKTRGMSTATLNVSGRDIDDREYVIDFDSSTATWKMSQDSAMLANLTPERRRVVELIQDQPCISRVALASKLKLEVNALDKRIHDMTKAGLIEKCSDGRGTYKVVDSVVDLVAA